MTSFEGADRTAQAIRQLLEIEPEALNRHLEGLEVGFRLPPGHPLKSPVYVGAELAVNLLCRTYPRIALDVDEFEYLADVAQGINPNAEVRRGVAGGPHFSFGDIQPSKGSVGQFAGEGWNVMVNQPGASPKFNVFAASVAACLGVAAIFRMVFEGNLEINSGSADTGVWSLLTQESSLASSDGFGVDRIDQTGRNSLDAVLVGAGAIGEACTWILGRSGIQGRLKVVDHERVDKGNLQRYVLASPKEVGARKTTLVARALPEMEVEEVPRRFDEASEVIGSAELVLSALDTASDRVSVQALLPHHLVNAWTQRSDLGVSVHRDFGTDPCLACLYWPRGMRPSLHEQMASIFGIHETRALAYLVTQVPVGQPLPLERLLSLPPRLERPPAIQDWTTSSLLDEWIEGDYVAEADAKIWEGRTLDSFYREAICGSAAVRFNSQLQEDEIPLPHQSALAGVLLAVAALEDVKWKEIRFDVLRPLPKSFQVPRQGTPGCICSDLVYRRRFAQKWAK
jgi:hypothetical protein